LCTLSCRVSPATLALGGLGKGRTEPSAAVEELPFTAVWAKPPMESRRAIAAMIDRQVRSLPGSLPVVLILKK
jgi:hypothetical protein